MIQALCNLFLYHVVEVRGKEKKQLKCQNDDSFLIYVCQSVVRLMRKERLRIGKGRFGQKLLGLFDGMIDDDSILTLYPEAEPLFGPKHRNRINYSETFLEGFSEADWSDQDVTSMDSQFFCSTALRPDRDFMDCDPETMESGEVDFGSDQGGWLWNTFCDYLRFLKRLDFKQSFISYEKIQLLNRRYLQEDYPNLGKKIDIELSKFRLRDVAL